MVLHIIVMAKIPMNMMMMMPLFQLSPLLWPFNLYLPSLRHLPNLCAAISRASALFLFRFRQIAAADRTGRTRLERAVRLIGEELPWNPQSRFFSSYMDETVMQFFV